MRQILGTGYAYGRDPLPVDLGGMRERVTLKSPALTSDTGGWKTDTPTTVASNVAVEIRELDGTEPFQAGAQRGIAQYQVRMRYRADVRAKWLLVWGSKTLEVLSPPSNQDGRKRFLWLLCGAVEA